MTKPANVIDGPGPRLLKEAIDTLHVSMTAVADVLGVTRQHISWLCRGGSVPSLDLAISLDELLGIPPRAWVRRTDKPRHERIAA